MIRLILVLMLLATSVKSATYTVPMNSNAVVQVPGFWSSNSVATLTNLTDTSNVLASAALRVPYATNSAYSTNAGIASTATNAQFASYSTNAGFATNASLSQYAGYATNASYATNSGSAATAGTATNLLGTNFAGLWVTNTVVAGNLLSLGGVPGTTNQVVIQGSNYGNTMWAQLRIQGDTNVNQQLRIGYDTGSNFGFAQASWHNVAYEPFLINPSGGNVAIGNYSPGVKLDVTGAIRASGGFVGDGLNLTNVTSPSDIRRFGAVANSTDCSVAISNAVLATGAAYIPPGYWKVFNPLLFSVTTTSQGARIWGDGPGISHLTSRGTTGSTFTWANPTPYIFSEYAGISNVSIEQEAEYTGIVSLVSVSSSHHFTLNNVRVSYSPGDAVRVEIESGDADSSTSVMVSGSEFSYNVGAGFNMYSTNARVQIVAPTFRSCRFLNNSGGGLIARGGSLNADNCIFAYNRIGVIGALDGALDNASFNYCLFEQNTNCNFYSRTVTGLTIFGCDFRIVSTEATNMIYLDGIAGTASDAVLTANQFVAPAVPSTLSGIYIAGTNYVRTHISASGWERFTDASETRLVDFGVATENLDGTNSWAVSGATATWPGKIAGDGSLLTGVPLSSNALTNNQSTAATFGAAVSSASNYVSGGSVIIGRLGVGLSPGAKFQIAADGSGPGSQQAWISGATASTKRLRFGYDTTSNFGHIDAQIAGVDYSPLILCEAGGNVGIGATSTNPPALLSVAGDARISTTLIVTNGITVPSGYVTTTNLSVTGNGTATIAGSIAVTNLLYTWVGTNFNGTNFAPLTTNIAPVLTPKGLFAYKSTATTNALAFGTGGYTNVLKSGVWDRVITNGFYASTNGSVGITNLYAGYYVVDCYVQIQADAGSRNDDVEGELFLNEVGQEHIAENRPIGGTAGDVTPVRSQGIIYIPANTGISYRIKDFTATRTLSILRAHITISTP